jgi:hypothetical protein
LLINNERENNSSCASEELLATIRNPKQQFTS